MGDMVARLKLESGEFDSKIKRATQGLLSMEQEFRAAGKSLSGLEKDQLNYVKSLGKMETASRTVRGQLGELKSGFTEFSALYKRMTEEEKKSQFGKALASSLDALKGRIKETRKNLEDINKTLNGSASGGISGSMQVFAGNMYTKAAEFAAELGKEIFDIANESADLSKQAQGIQDAFERLGRGDLLDGLREATHGTVTDLELMKSAVKFADFNLPLDQLGTMLAFAQQKAKDTGQSVDYMVDSIVTGLGRKSLMILDNLGLSAAEIKKRMKETGDMTVAVGEIIKERMSAAGDYVETAADRSKQATVSLQNAMLQLGTAMRETFGYTGWNDVATSMKAKLVPVLTEIIGYLGEIKSFWGGKTIDQAQKEMYGTVGMPNELKADLETLKNTPVEDRQRKFAEIERKYAKRYRDKLNEASSAGSDYQSTQERADKSSSAGAWAALSIKSFFQKANTKNLYTEADAAAKILGLFRSEAHKILTPGTGKPIVPPKDDPDDDKLPKLNKLQEIEAQIAKLTSEAMEADRMRLEVIRAEIAALQEQAVQYKTIAAYAGGNYYSKGAKVEDPRTWSTAGSSASTSSGIVDEFTKINIAGKLSPIVDVGKKTKESWKDAAKAVASVGSALEGLEDPSAKIAGIVGQAVANIALGFAQATASDSKLGVFGWIAAIAGGLGTMISTIAAIKSATKGYSEGGIVQGNSYSGDNVGPVMLDAGEVILNRAQAANVASALKGNDNRSYGGGIPYVTGDKIVLGINNWGKKNGKGELVFSRT